MGWISGSVTARSQATQPQANNTAIRLPYLAGLDGLRAVAVIAVLLYHAGLSVWGSFLGVETFFVLSGYLITALLLVEWQQDEPISLAAFWLRRARRLLPALLLVLVGTLALTRAVIPDEGSGLRADMTAALAYVMNLHLITGEQSYFDPQARPPLLQHLWSLAIEEQFYLLWPIMFSVGLRYLRRYGLLLALLVGSIASTLLMTSLFQPGADSSRAYYGTNTRAAGILLVCALAVLWMPGAMPAATRRGMGWTLNALRLLALAAMLTGYMRLFEYHPLLYRGGFALIAGATAVLIAAVTHPQTRILPALLGALPLRWIGLRSGTIYLWH